MTSVVWNLPRENNDIALTFDDGPHPEITLWVCDILEKYNIKATFFVLGENVEKYKKVYQYLISSGHRIGIHGYTHIDGWEANLRDYVADVEYAAKFINSDLFRPPYGRITHDKINALKDKYKIVMFDVLAGDFDEELTKEKCLLHAIQNTQEGSIITFHDNEKSYKTLQYVLPAYIEHCQLCGFNFVTL
jgi:peptidoglycan/xylan/chitin deacetylase (PgdA/CDA1 family)